MKILRFCLIISSIHSLISGEKSFVIDYKNNQFLKDGKPFTYISGSIHYFRVPSIYWRDRLQKLLAAGFNTIQTYIEWSQHEPSPNTYIFEDNLDVIKFITLAHELGLLVIIRAGPYICAERDMGGLPFWLLQQNSSIRLRSSDPFYLKYVDKWYHVLLPMLKPYLYSVGGPIIAVQVENEYGGYPECDKDYMWHLHTIFRLYLPAVILFTTDAAHDANLECGTIDGFYKTVDFEPTRNVTDAFETMRRHQPSGPLVNSELYDGWLDHWSYGHTNTFSEINVILKAMEEILSINASVNIYMFHGGTSFGFTNGANYDGGQYKACPTSYDYNALLSEAGDPTDKYYAIQNLISKFKPIPTYPAPSPTIKFPYGKVNLEPLGSLFSLLKIIAPSSIDSVYPRTFEDIGQAYGFVLYETIINGIFMDPASLHIPELRDRGIIFLDESPRGILSRQNEMLSLPLKVKQGQKLSILVENQGRITYGPNITDFKGIVGNVTLDGNIIKNWKIIPILLNSTLLLNKVLMKKGCLTCREDYSCNNYTKPPAFFGGTFTVPDYLQDPLDTFLSTPGWSKGVAFINGENVGRYWPAVGPQMTLYIPKSLLRPNPTKNNVLLFELEEAPCSSTNTIHQCMIEFVSEPNINGPTPNPVEPIKILL